VLRAAFVDGKSKTFVLTQTAVDNIYKDMDRKFGIDLSPKELELLGFTDSETTQFVPVKKAAQYLVDKVAAHVVFTESEPDTVEEVSLHRACYMLLSGPFEYLTIL